MGLSPRFPDMASAQAWWPRLPASVHTAPASRPPGRPCRGAWWPGTPVAVCPGCHLISSHLPGPPPKHAACGSVCSRVPMGGACVLMAQTPGQVAGDGLCKKCRSFPSRCEHHERAFPALPRGARAHETPPSWPWWSGLSFVSSVRGGAGADLFASGTETPWATCGKTSPSPLIIFVAF